MRWVAILFVVLFCQCKQKTEVFDAVANSSSTVQKFFQSKDKFEVQVVYTQIDRDSDDNPHFTSYSYNYDSSRYFYPASTVKMPVAFLALQKLKEIGVYRGATIQIDSARAPQSKAFTDSTSVTGLPSVAHYIEKIFAVSNNDAYNRLYEFLGQDYINRELREKDIFTNSRIVTRVGIGGFSTEDNRYTNPISFLNEAGKVTYAQEAVEADGDYFQPLQQTIKGKGYYDDNLDTVVYEQFDMSKKNFINLKDLEASMKRILFPNSFDKESRFDLRDDDYSFLWETMQKLPREHPYLQDHLEEYYDSYVKFFLFGDEKDPMPDHIRIFNKVGFAYGYLTDCAYIIDTDKKIEFFLTATVHVNENQIYNDGKYEYDEGIKFLAELGRVVYNLELNRERKFFPDFTKYIKQN